MAQTYRISKPDNTTIVEVLTDGIVVEKYSFNNSKDIQLASNCLVIDGLENSSGTLRIPFEKVENNYKTSNASELMSIWAELGFFLSANCCDDSSSGPIEGTWQEIKDLIVNEELIPGDTYILTDYQTKYMIEGTDTEDSENLLPLVGTASGYGQFSCIDSEILNANNALGKELTIKEIPSSYTGPLTVGQTVTIDAYFNCSFVRFSPRVTTAGIVLSLKKLKYPNVPSNAVSNDGNGKPALKPKGVINTDVHDGTPYLNMSAEENPEVPIERIALKAIDERTFSLKAESLTYVGDSLLYDFNDTDVLADSGEVISKRNGFILRRTNLDGTISVDKDWRVQRYRRYQVLGSELNKLRHYEGQDGRSANIYKYGEYNFGTAAAPTDDNIYLSKFPYEIAYYIDFTKLSEDPFIEGGNNLPTNGNDIQPADDLLVDLSLDYEDLAFTSKDFFIFPVENNDKTDIVNIFNVSNLENSVFLANNSAYGGSNDISVSLKNSLTDSSFMSGVTLNSSSSLNKIITFGGCTINNYSLNNINNLTIFASASFYNYGTINNVFVGQDLNSSTVLNVNHQITVKSGTRLLSTMIGGKRAQQLFFEGNIDHCLIRMEYIETSLIKGNMYLTTIGSTNGGNTLHRGWELELNTWGSKVPGKTEPGFKYLYNIFPNNTKLNNFNDNKDLVYTRVLSNGNTELVTFSTPL